MSCRLPGPSGGTTIGIAVDVPPPWGERLTRRRAAAGDSQAEYVPAHVTLLGPTKVDPTRMREIDAHLLSVARAHPPFALHLRGTGTFRPVTEVVFVAVAVGVGECERLAAAIDDCDAINRPRRYPYHPHVTVAQDVETDQLDAVSADLAGFEARFVVGGFRLFEHGVDSHWRVRCDYVLSAPPPVG